MHKNTCSQFSLRRADCRAKELHTPDRHHEPASIDTTQRGFHLLFTSSIPGEGGRKVGAAWEQAGQLVTPRRTGTDTSDHPWRDSGRRLSETVGRITHPCLSMGWPVRGRERLGRSLPHPVVPLVPPVHPIVHPPGYRVFANTLSHRSDGSHSSYSMLLPRVIHPAFQILSCK